MLSPRKQSLLRTLTDMGRHQQGNHGWSLFHECLSEVAESGQTDGLDELLAALWSRRPDISDTHAITLIGIAVRQLALRERAFADVFRAELAPPRRTPVLARALSERTHDIGRLMESHSNSYTGARRFLVPQLVIGAFAEHRRVHRVRLLDLGTSIGLLPRQLNNRRVFDRFAGDLDWRPAAPPFRRIPLAYVGGVDRPPLPTLDWVRACHGPSDYYEQRFEEVRWSLEQAEPADTEAVLEPLDLLDQAALAGLLETRRINVVTCNFVLYQYTEDVTRRIVETVVGALGTPSLLLSMEPSHALTRMGCVVHAYLDGSPKPVLVADASDGHLVGTVTVHDGFAELAGQDWRR